MNLMRTIRIEKVTLNVGAGKSQDKLDKGMKLLKNITGIDPVKTKTTKRIAGWGLRPGLPIGCKITLRGKKGKEILDQLIQAKDKKLNPKQFDDYGNVAFGIHEYIDIPGVRYDPDIGIIGFEVCVTLNRPGYRIKSRKYKKKKVGKKHLVNKQDAIDFMKKELNIEVGEE